MNFKIIRFTDLHAAPSADSPIVADLLPSDVLVSIDTVPEQNGFTNVNLFRSAGSPIPGWVLKADVESTQPPPRPPLSVAGFVRECIAVERDFNRLDTTAPWFVAADFLVARAIIETKLKNEGQLGANKDGVGPLQVSSEEWKLFRDQFNNATFKADANFSDNDFRDAARDHPILQIWGAAARMFRDAKALSESRRAAGVGTAEDPFIPSYLNVFGAYVANSPAAGLAVRDAAEKSGERDKPVVDVLKTVLTDEQLNELAKARSTDRNNLGTVAEIVAKAEATLADALKQAADLIAQHAPAEVAIISAAGGGGAAAGGVGAGGGGDSIGAVWIPPARLELAAGVSNATHANRIVGYFEHTDLQPRPTSIVAWCGAFAAHCMSASDTDAVEASIPPSSALAVSWKKWGVGIPSGGTIPPGAVVVLSPAPPVTGGSGHVGFFVRREGNSVVLLGGNQGKRVSETRFPASLIAKVCWFGEVANVNVGSISAGPAKVGPLNDADWQKYCEVLGHRESGNDYTKTNQFNYVGRWQFGAPALAEVGYVHSGKKNRDLPSPSAWIGRDGISSMAAWKGSKPVQDAAMLAFTQLYYKRLIKLGALSPQASKPNVAGMLAAAHLKGPGGALQFSRGIVTADANGTTTKSYYKLLSQALGGTGIHPG